MCNILLWVVVVVGFVVFGLIVVVGIFFIECVVWDLFVCFGLFIDCVMLWIVLVL